MHYYQDTHLTAPERDQRITELRARGYSLRAIGKAVGMSGGGVKLALDRIAAGLPGRDPRP